MAFKWKCPYCNNLYTYNGVQEKRATGKCSNKKCLSYRVSVKIWQYRQIEKKIISTPKKVYKKEIHQTKIPPTVRITKATTITNSLLRSINLIFTGVERIPGRQTNVRYAQAIIKVLEKIK